MVNTADKYLVSIAFRLRTTEQVGKWKLLFFTYIGYVMPLLLMAGHVRDQNWLCS